MNPKTNNIGRVWNEVPDPSWGDGGSFIEVRETDETGKEGEVLASFYVKPDESEDDAIKAALVEAFDPLAPWEMDYDPQTKEVLVWLAEALGIDTEEYRK